MDAAGRLAAGEAALREARWEDARDCFAAALAREETPEALDGLGTALWWCHEPTAGCVARARAYAGYRRAGRTTQAGRVAVWLAREYRGLFRNPALADGWLARARGLLGDGDHTDTGAGTDTVEKAVARRFYEAVESGEPTRLDDVCAPDLRGHAGAGADLAELKQSIGSFTDAFPDMRADVRHLVQEGPLVSTWVSYTATHRGEFAGVPASGRRVRFAAWDLMEVRDGRLVELTQYCDLFTILSQIGALPTAAPA